MTYRPWVGRRFGVEMEVNSRYRLSGRSLAQDTLRTAVEEAIRPFNVPMGRRSGYFHSDGTTWDVKTDSSCGYEIVSPALSMGEDGEIPQIKAVLDRVNRLGPSCDASCGLHVHVEMRDFTWQDIRSLTALWSRYEPFFFDLMPEGRRTNHYCPPYNRSSWEDERPQFTFRRARRTFNITNETIFRGLSSSITSRGALNLGHWWGSERVEFRLGAGTLDYTTIRNWVILLLAVAQRIKNAAMPPIQPVDSWTPGQGYDSEYVCKVLGLVPSRHVPQVGPEAEGVVTWIKRRRAAMAPRAVTYRDVSFVDRTPTPILVGPAVDFEARERIPSNLRCCVHGCPNRHSVGQSMCEGHRFIHRVLIETGENADYDMASDLARGEPLEVYSASEASRFEGWQQVLEEYIRMQQNRCTIAGCVETRNGNPGDQFCTMHQRWYGRGSQLRRAEMEEGALNSMFREDMRYQDRDDQMRELERAAQAERTRRAAGTQPPVANDESPIGPAVRAGVFRFGRSDEWEMDRDDGGRAYLHGYACVDRPADA